MPFSTPTRRRMWIGVLVAFSLLVVANTFRSQLNDYNSRHRHSEQKEEIDRIFRELSQTKGAYVQDGGPGRLKEVEARLDLIERKLFGAAEKGTDK